jgi:hypothetical protein
MAKYTELQTRKLISSYGGVGSIIETIYGALLIKPFDKWLYFYLLNKGKTELTDDEIIEDERLLKRLQVLFPKLKTLVKVPENYSALYNTSLPKIKENIIDAEYFPKWFYCNKCGSLKPINEWWKGWTTVYKGTTQQQQDSFTPPVCYKCYQNAKEKKEKRKFYPLEQVRFILTSPNGEIKDIPWEQWTNITKEKDDDGITKIKFNGKCCQKQDLKYIKSKRFSDFSGVQIKCGNPDCKTQGKPISLAGLFGVRAFCEEIKDKDGNVVLDKKAKPIKSCFKPVIRTSNSVYYPLITNSLYLPHKENLSKDDKVTAYNLYHNKNKTIEQISDFLEISIEELKDYLEPSDFITEIEYRLKEYRFLTTAESPDDNNLAFEIEKSEQLKAYGIEKLLKINRLKLSSVQTGYTRQEPIDKDLFAEYSMNDYIPTGRHSVKAKYTSTKGENAEFLPGVENYGEGIFIEFNSEYLNNWYKQIEKNAIFSERLERIITNANNSDIHLSEEKSKMLANKAYLSKFLILHTLSHILIKELEFLVGYPATSLSERLYINENDMQGILIYTIAGSEGSFGGLVSQANTERFIRIINSALVRAKDCASDPICYNSEGQGIGGLNLAACYSCSLLPETSCEEFNSFLDRAILIDNDYGFYRHI